MYCFMRYDGASGVNVKSTFLIGVDMRICESILFLPQQINKSFICYHRSIKKSSFLKKLREKFFLENSGCEGKFHRELILAMGMLLRVL